MRKILLATILLTSIKSFAGVCSIELKKQWSYDSKPSQDSKIIIDLETLDDCKQKAIELREERHREIGIHKMVSLKAEYVFVEGVQKGSVGFLPEDFNIESNKKKID